MPTLTRNPLKKLNREMKLFLLRLVSMVVIWQAAYIFVLKPRRVPDELLTKTLAAAVTKTLNLFFHPFPPITWVNAPAQLACFVQKYGKTILVIFDDCNGLDLFIIYLAFIILLPYSAARKLVFSAAGIVAIFIGNIFRCVVLYWIYVNYRGMFEFNHHYVFTIIMYLIIFAGWVLYTKKPKENEIS